MDSRRLDTLQVLGAGILNKPIPETDIPDEREEHRCDIDDLNKDVLRAALAEGKLLSLSEYYGCLSAWSDQSGHHGRLLQYRSVTSKPDFKSADDLIKWFIKTGRSVAG